MLFYHNLFTVYLCNLRIFARQNIDVSKAPNPLCQLIFVFVYLYILDVEIENLN